MFAMTAQAQKLGDNQLRAPARPGAIDGFADHFEAGIKIRPVQNPAFHPITFGAIHERLAGELARIWG